MNAKRIALALAGAEIGFAAVFGTMGATGHMTGVAYASECYTEQWEPMECPAGEIAPVGGACDE